MNYIIYFRSVHSNFANSFTNFLFIHARYYFIEDDNVVFIINKPKDNDYIKLLKGL